MTDTSFSSGFASGGSVINAREDRRVLEEQNRLDQQNLMRERGTANIAESLELLKVSSKNQSAAYFTSKGNNDQKGMDTAIAVQTEAAKALWKSNEEMLRRIGTPEDEIANTKEQFRIAASLNNPAAEQKLIAAGEAEGKLASQQALEGQKQDAVQKQFLNSLDETVTQTKDGQFIDTQGNLITDVKKLNNLRNIPTTQNINTTTNTPKTVSTLQDKLIQTRDRKQRLLNIRASFRPELLETWTKLRAKFVAGTEKHLGIEPSEKDKQLITDITNFRGETALGINQTIHDMTGAQMSQFEAKRLRMPEPDVGEKLLEGQSPTEFKANVERAIRDMELADLRFTKLLKEGVITEADIDAGTAGDKAMGLIPLSKMEELYEQRGVQILEEVKLINPKLTDDEAFNMANQKLKAEFTM